jgi:hypothetical protein
MNTSDIQTTDIHFQSLDQLEVRLQKRHDENHLFSIRAANTAATLQVFTYTHPLTLGPFIIRACTGPRSDFAPLGRRKRSAPSESIRSARKLGCPGKRRSGKRE